MAVILQDFTDTLIFLFFEYFLVSVTTGHDTVQWIPTIKKLNFCIKSSGPVDRMKQQLTSDLRRASRMTSFQDFPILDLGYSSFVAPIKVFLYTNLPHSNWVLSGTIFPFRSKIKIRKS